jgi:anti-sigma regulatory factor (Ser/Thr protein kinase)
MKHGARFPAVTTSALDARQFVSSAIADVPDDVSDAVSLITSELASNSVRHATSAFEVRVERLPDRIRIEVEDDGAGDPNLRAPGPSDTSGRGLQIVSALADEWGVIPRRDAPGKIVWVTVILRAIENERLKSEETPTERRSSGTKGSGGGSSASCSDPWPAAADPQFTGTSLLRPPRPIGCLRVPVGTAGHCSSLH